mmetsp:Transcript_10056/g.28850  ORF Transcript_10056/g.28850 Transcript_10056/m.28850 type:complete len:137 (+) Transcript_10056:1221-1631(+)
MVPSNRGDGLIMPALLEPKLANLDDIRRELCWLVMSSSSCAAKPSAPATGWRTATSATPAEIPALVTPLETTTAATTTPGAATATPAPPTTRAVCHIHVAHVHRTPLLAPGNSKDYCQSPRRRILGIFGGIQKARL